MTQARRFASGIFLLTGLAGTVAVSADKKAAAPRALENHEWRVYGGDKSFQRYSSLDLINQDNVKNLQVVWVRPSIDAQYKEVFPDLVGSN